ncbi:MAG: monooxygenase FAD-binding [Capsulimonas sp.]|nr:monooxygenase FAD-binding [Capsulimonas sp.]
MSNTQVLIVGAGPTGLVLALNLARHGVSFRIIDKNSGPGQASRAMVVHARTLEFYRQLGFGDEVVSLGIPMEAVHFREGNEEVAKLDFKDNGAGLSPYPFALCFPQDDHERFLVAKLAEASVAIEWNTELKEFIDDGSHVQATLEKDGSEETVQADYLCGCDGARSRVRQTLGFDFPGGTYDQDFYVADVKVANGENRDLIINVGSHTFVLMLPVHSTGMQRLIGIVPPELAGQTNVTFEQIQPSAEKMIDTTVEQVHWFSTYHVHHRVASHFRAGRIFIAGDAGHIHSPAGGQGMNTGIGDAVNLSWKLAHVLQGRIDPSVLDTYEEERIKFARTLVATTDRAFEAMVGEGVGSQIFRTWLLPHVLPFLTGFSAVRQTMFSAVSQTRINYHGSALSQGHAGDLQGGDRLPWTPAPATDNFAPLSALDWQIHIYGAPTPDLRAAASDLGLPIQEFPWTDAAEHAGLEKDAFYLVRPDGYVALASAHQDIEPLKAYAAKFAFQP